MRKKIPDPLWNPSGKRISFKNQIMFRKHVLMALIVSSINLYAQTGKSVDSKISDVTVFLNRAQVTRVAKTRLESGKSTLIFQGLTSQLDQQSIQVAGKGKFTIVGISHQQNYAKEFASSKTQKLRDSIEYVRQQIAIETNMKEILNKEEQMLLSNQKIGGTNQNLTVTELKAMADFYRVRLSEISQQRFKQDNKIGDLNEQLSRLQKQLKEINELYARHTSEILVTISADAETSAEFELNYVVANAGWVPVYDLRATDTRSPVQLSYKANVFQGTGEEWKNVRLTLSTANPTLGGVKPELSPLYVDLLRQVVRTARYRHGGPGYSNAKAAPVEVEADYEEDKSDSTTLADYTTTIQTTLNTEFAISLPYTVNSSNKPTLVDIANHSLKAEYLYSVSPKLDRDAFLMAMVTGWEEFSLLPGEANVFFEGTFVAKSFIDPQSIKDTLSVSLGRDKRIVVQREKIKDLSTRKTMGANQKDTYGYTISVRNAKAENIEIIVEDQVPVSQNSQVEVTVLDNGGAQYHKDYGKLRWEFLLKPQETRKLEYKYEVRYPKDKMITQLN
jgi:uncharacterized protein (TIGR02231 family)